MPAERDTELWCCPACEMIGSAQEANGHEASTGHTIRKLNAAEEQGVREIWQEEGRDPMGRSLAARSENVVGLLTMLGRRVSGGGGLDGPDF